jgi:hypothetical protein
MIENLVAHLKDDDFKDFIDFTQNPEIYFDAKKYNL